MSTTSRRGGRLLAGGAIAGAAACVGWVGLEWWRFGRPAAPSAAERDPLLDRFMPQCDVVDRQHIRVAAPAATTLDVAQQLEFDRLPIVRAIFSAREWLLGGSALDLPPGLIERMRALGWGVLAERPGREIVMGAVTRPWEANPTFRAIAPVDFAAWAEPGYVKIAWTLRADPIDDTSCVFRTETRAVATDPSARARFRRYWACLSPGIRVIRLALLRPLKQQAEAAPTTKACQTLR